MSLIEKTGAPIGSYAPDFELPGVDDTVHHLARYLEQYQIVGVVFLANHCPDVERYIGRLKQLQSEFQSQGLTLIGINANDAMQNPQESFEQMKVFATQQSLNFPYLRDVTQDVAHCFGAESTPEVFLLNHQGAICYRGGIDDSPEDPSAATQVYLQAAIAQLLAGKPVNPEIAPTTGCPITWRTP
ncbi:MAG: thioredoxin family protein [Desertifilum sp.]|nr:thioredoxin family protein [Desertifilum sp.]